MSTFKELIRKVKSRDPRGLRRGGARPRRSGRRPRRRARGRRVVAGPRARRSLHPPRLPRAADRGEGARTSGQEVVVYCAGGTRSALGRASRSRTSATRTSPRWRAASAAGRRPGFPIVVPKTLSAEQKKRYSRHLLVPEVGEAGQAKLLDVEGAARRARAASARPPASTWPRRAWARSASSTPTWSTSPTCSGRCCTRPPRVGTPKTESAEATIRALNPDVKVVRHDLRLEAANVMDVIAPYDVILDGCDNFSTKYLVNDAAVLAGKTERLRQHLPLRRPGLDLRARGRGPATAASIPSPRPPSWRPPATRRACSACCPASSASSRPRRPSRPSSGKGDLLDGPAAHLRRARHDVPRSSRCAATPSARSAATQPTIKAPVRPRVVVPLRAAAAAAAPA